MSTSVIRPGTTAQQEPSGKTFGILIAGLVAAIVLGFVFYTNQDQNSGPAGVQSQVGQLTDGWMSQHQAELNSARDQSAAAETARLQAMAEAYAVSQAEPNSAQVIAQSIAAEIAERTQAQIAVQGESFAPGLQVSKASQAWTDRLTGLANASTGGGVNPAFGHELEPQGGSGNNGSTVRVPAR